MACICVFVILPLNLVGTVLGRNLAGSPNYPCRVKAVPRPIPEKKWYSPFISLIATLLSHVYFLFVIFAILQPVVVACSVVMVVAWLSSIFWKMCLV